MTFQAKLLGLDKSEKVDVNNWDFTGEDLDVEVRRIVTMIAEHEDQFTQR